MGWRINEERRAGMATAVAPRTQPISPSSGTKHILPIEGMSCASCVARVERAIRAVPGAENVSVNVATERATITAAPDLAPWAVAHAIEQAGYTVGAETFDLSVRGMTCASCASRIERALKAVPGVLDAEVNLATERARVTAAAGSVLPADVLRAIEVARYDAVLPAAHAAD